MRPRPSAWRDLDATGRSGVPAAGLALAILLAGLPVSLPGQAELQSGLAVGGVFYWSVQRPSSMPPVAVFLLGLFSDLLGLYPFGVGTLVLLIAHGAASRFRRALHGQSLPFLWMAFLPVIAGAVALQWALVSALRGTPMQSAPAVFQFSFGLGLFPFLAWVLDRADRGVAAPDLA